MIRARAGLAAAAACAVMLVAAGCGLGRSEPGAEAPDGHVHDGAAVVLDGPAPRAAASSRVDGLGSFAVRCGFVTRQPDDPIVHRDQPGASHSHDFFGASLPGPSSTAVSLMAGETTCTSPGDRSAYWVPTLYDGDQVVEPLEAAAYYRAVPGSDPAALVAPPQGLELLSDWAGWACGRADDPAPGAPACPASSLTRLVLGFPDCWDGVHLQSPDHRSHVTDSVDGRCPASHPVAMTRVVIEIRYKVDPEASLRFSSGPVTQAHGDVLIAWDRAAIDRELRSCVRRQVVCDLTWNTVLGSY